MMWQLSAQRALEARKTREKDMKSKLDEFLVVRHRARYHPRCIALRDATFPFLIRLHGRAHELDGGTIPLPLWLLSSTLSSSGSLKRATKQTPKQPRRC